MSAAPYRDPQSSPSYPGHDTCAVTGGGVWRGTETLADSRSALSLIKCNASPLNSEYVQRPNAHASTLHVGICAQRPPRSCAPAPSPVPLRPTTCSLTPHNEAHAFTPVQITSCFSFLMAISAQVAAPRQRAAVGVPAVAASPSSQLRAIRSPQCDARSAPVSTATAT